jgi:hypothetical protein
MQRCTYGHGCPKCNLKWFAIESGPCVINGDSTCPRCDSTLKVDGTWQYDDTDDMEAYVLNVQRGVYESPAGSREDITK